MYTQLETLQMMPHWANFCFTKVLGDPVKLPSQSEFMPDKQHWKSIMQDTSEWLVHLPDPHSGDENMVDMLHDSIGNPLQLVPWVDHDVATATALSHSLAMHDGTSSRYAESVMPGKSTGFNISDVANRAYSRACDYLCDSLSMSSFTCAYACAYTYIYWRGNVRFVSAHSPLYSYVCIYF
jgi:hypothetical protein